MNERETIFTNLSEIEKKQSKQRQPVQNNCIVAFHLAIVPIDCRKREENNQRDGLNKKTHQSLNDKEMIMDVNS